MLRNILLIGIVVGASTSVPILYESNPEMFNRLISRDTGQSEESEEILVPVIRVEQEDRDTEYLMGRRVAIPMDDQGHFSTAFRFNGRDIDSLVDTGATLVAINRATAKRVGLKLAESDFRYRVNTANGVARAAAVVIDDLEIGRIHADNVSAIVLEDSALDSTLIGMSFLKKLRSFRVEGDRLYLEQ